MGRSALCHSIYAHTFSAERIVGHHTERYGETWCTGLIFLWCRCEFKHAFPIQLVHHSENVVQCFCDAFKFNDLYIIGRTVLVFVWSGEEVQSWNLRIVERSVIAGANAAFSGLDLDLYTRVVLDDAFKT